MDMTLENKAYIDALTGIFYRDDSQIVKCTHEKRYGDVPLVQVTVRRVGEEWP